MDVKALLQNLRSEVSCSICANTYTDPKQLPCLHSFCLHCLNRWRTTGGGNRHNNTITCPECRGVFKVPGSGDLKDLPTNFRINSLVDVLAIKDCRTVGVKCGNCEKRSFQGFYCFQCCAFWCDDCITAHNIIRKNKDHRVLALKDFKDEDIKDDLKRPVFCQKKHHEKEVLRFFCKDCEDAFCSTCVTTLHSGHALIELEEAADEQRAEINSLIEAMKQNALKKRNKVTELEKNCIEIRAKAAAIKSQVHMHCNAMIKLIEARENDILAQVEYQAEELLEDLKIQMSEIQDRAKVMEASAREAKSLLEQSTDAKVVHLKKTLSQLGVDELEDPDDCNVVYVPEFTFLENRKFSNAVSTEEIGLFVVTFKKTEAHQSIAKGNGIHEAIAGVEAKFVLLTRNAQGSLNHGVLDSVTMEITNYQGEDCATEVKIRDNNDGTYEISYSVQEAGKYNTTVKLNGEHVPGSPFALDVRSQKMKGICRKIL